MLEGETELNEKFKKWSESRDWFLWALGKLKPDVVAKGWQKDYLQAAKDKKLLAQEFVDRRPRNESNQSDGNHEIP